MNNIRNSQNNSSQSETVYHHFIFSFDREDCSIAEMLTVVSVDYLDLIYLPNVSTTESPFAAIRVSIDTLNLLIIVVPTSTHPNYLVAHTAKRLNSPPQKVII